MANIKIVDLPELNTAIESTDLLLVQDMSGGGDGVSKKVDFSSIQGEVVQSSTVPGLTVIFDAQYDEIQFLTIPLKAGYRCRVQGKCYLQSGVEVDISYNYGEGETRYANSILANTSYVPTLMQDTVELNITTQRHAVFDFSVYNNTVTDTTFWLYGYNRGAGAANVAVQFVVVTIYKESDFIDLTQTPL